MKTNLLTMSDRGKREYEIHPKLLRQSIKLARRSSVRGGTSLERRQISIRTFNLLHKFDEFVFDKSFPQTRNRGRGSNLRISIN